MDGTAKTLAEMDPRERSDMFDKVAGALEVAANQATASGDSRFAAGSSSLASTIRGYARRIEHHDLKSGELLLRQGIMLLHLFSKRGGGPAGAH